MKKAIVLLLVLAVAGTAFAQVNTGIYVHGTVTLIDQDLNGVQDPNSWAANTLTLKGSNDDMGFAATWTNALITGIPGEARDWTAYYNLFEKKVKMTFGKFRNATFRQGNVYAFYTDRITGYGWLTELKFVDGLNIGLFLPFTTTAEPMADILQKTDIGITYTIADIGKITLLANLDLINSTNKINFGFSLAAVENLTAILNYKGTFATTSSHSFGVGVQYDLMDGNLWIGTEFDGQYASAFDWQVYPYAGYMLNDNINFAFDGYYGSDSTYSFGVTANYDFLVGLVAALNVGYADTGLFYSLGMSYDIAF